MIRNEKELVSVRIPKELNKKFAEHVASMGISKTAFILNFLNHELRKENIAPTSPLSEFDTDKKYYKGDFR